MQRYLKYMLAVLSVVAGLSLNSVSTYNNAHAAFAWQQNLVRAVNSIRARYRLPKLQLHPSLQRAAQEQSVLMAKAGKMSHKVGFRHGLASRLKRVGYRGLAAENIARGQKSLGRVLSGWMRSPGHRRNMLHPRMRYFGLSVVKGGGRNYWTMVLGG